MSEQSAGVVVSIVGLVVPIAGWLLEPFTERRIAAFRNRSAPGYPRFDYYSFPSAAVQPPPADGTHPSASARTGRQLKWATVIMPLTTLIYGLFDLRVGVNYFHMSPVLGAVIALLFTTVITSLMGWIDAGSRRAIGTAARICGVYGWVFLAFSAFFLFTTVVALTRVVGITYFVAELDRPVLTTLLSGVLAALSALAWRATENSADLLKALGR